MDMAFHIAGCVVLLGPTRKRVAALKMLPPSQLLGIFMTGLYAPSSPPFLRNGVICAWCPDPRDDTGGWLKLKATNACNLPLVFERPIYVCQ